MSDTKSETKSVTELIATAKKLHRGAQLGKTLQIDWEKLDRAIGAAVQPFCDLLEELFGGPEEPKGPKEPKEPEEPGEPEEPTGG
jgi:hypothetical protein